MATTELLTDDNHTRQDLRMIKQAIVHNWDIPEQLFSALPKVAGALALNGKAKEKLAAMALLIKMKDQNDKSNQPQPQKPSPQTTTNIQVNVGNPTDERRNLTLAIAERVRAGRVLVSDSGE